MKIEETKTARSGGRKGRDFFFLHPSSFIL
jgi:hypothetical protein